MLNEYQRPHLFRSLDNNNCILFVGAGFSHDARNKLGNYLPLSRDFAAVLWNWLGLDGDYNGDPLTVLFEAALSSGQPLDRLRSLLEDHLLAEQIDAWYGVIPRVLWHRIYGTNVDNAIELAYRVANVEPTLEVIAAPRDDYRDRDQFIRRIQYIKLNGTLPGDPRELTFATLQYARRANSKDEWYHHFVRDYVYHPTVFVGSEMDEPLFWQAIEERGRRGPAGEDRPGSYLVSPSLSPAKQVVLESLGISYIKASGADFFRWLAAEYGFPSREDTLRVIMPEAAALLGGLGVSARMRDNLAEFFSVFQRVPLVLPNAGRPRLFLLGAPPSWGDITAGLDAAREINSEVRGAVDNAIADAGRIAVIGILGEGGAGKSTILRRTAFALRQSGQQVFFTESAERPDIRAVSESIASIEERTILFFDNVSLLGPVFPQLLRVLATLTRPPVVVFASRYVQYERRLREALHGSTLTLHFIPDLSDTDITNLIATLERHNQLGRLSRMTADERRYEFKHRARKQLLVAMREATEGDGFDLIIENEYAEIESAEARILFLCAALATAELVYLTEEQWFGCSEVAPTDALDILHRGLRGMVHPHDGNRRIVARHPIIAELILDRIAGRGDVMEAYRRLLQTLATDIYGGPGRRKHSWRLFVRLINHQEIFNRFGEDIERARGVFELTAGAFRNDGHFWLQYANLEIDYGLAEYAKPHLANAEGLLGETDQVLTTRAHLALREALTAGSYEQALRLRRDAEDILLHQIEASGHEDEYPFHVYLTHILSWIRAWSPDRETRKADLENLIEIARQATRLHPSNRRLKNAHDALMREYLMLGVTRNTT